jgi:hypothetical protein
MENTCTVIMFMLIGPQARPPRGATLPRYVLQWGFDARRAVFVLTRSSACAKSDVSVIKTILPCNSEPPMSAIRGVVSTIVLGSTTTPNDFVARC